MGGIAGVGNSRYKYDMILSAEGSNQTKLVIICKVESTLTGLSTSTQWRDVSKLNEPLTTSLEKWLYEQIEKSMQ